jgi:hypothetical protein
VSDPPKSAVTTKYSDPYLLILKDRRRKKKKEEDLEESNIVEQICGTRA